MGPLIMSMPRTTYQGAFSEPTGGGATTKLVGSAVEEEELYSRQAASRLSAKLQRTAVMVSCSFRGGLDAPAVGMDPTLLQHRAAALAEKRVYEILKDLQSKGTL